MTQNTFVIRKTTAIKRKLQWLLFKVPNQRFPALIETARLHAGSPSSENSWNVVEARKEASLLAEGGGGASKQVLLCDKIIPLSILAPGGYGGSISGRHPKLAFCRKRTLRLICFPHSDTFQIEISAREEGVEAVRMFYVLEGSAF